MSSANKNTKANAFLWTVQVILALLFLFAGGMKLVMPIEMLKGPVALPGVFLRFIGVCEVLGALGLILPGLTRIRTNLTPLAAAGLVIIMVGAVAVTVLGGPVGPAVVPFVVGLLAASIAYGRSRVAPLRESPRRALSISPALVRHAGRA
jgi:uncharacterized membrane protein YphA (DoxX/SURF4 family)